MSDNYKITNVSDYIKDWSSDKWGEFTTYYVKVDELDGVVEVNKKRGGDGPVVGDMLEGLFTESDYTDKQGNVHYKFKAVKPYSGGGGYTPKDEAAIKAMWAIGQAVNWLKDGENDVTDIEPLAKDLFPMVDRVKVGLAPEGTARDWDKLGKPKDGKDQIVDMPEEMPPDFGLKDGNFGQ